MSACGAASRPLTSPPTFSSLTSLSSVAPSVPNASACGAGSTDPGLVFPPPLRTESPVTNSDLAGFTAAEAIFTHLPATIFMITPGSARNAYMPSVDTYWGYATYELRPGVNSAAYTLQGVFDSPGDRLVLLRAPGCHGRTTGDHRYRSHVPMRRIFLSGFRMPGILNLPRRRPALKALCCQILGRDRRLPWEAGDRSTDRR